MSRELKKAYDPKETDSKWYNFWEEGGFFKADASSKKRPFTVVMPPPNVTGKLHMGHALVTTIQDCAIRWKRMSGFEALWIPGTDHAGIATQTVVERKLFEETKKRRFDFSREEFLSHVFAWKDEYESRIIEQIKKMGASCDWSRLRFTMDEKSNMSVKTLFKKLYDDGLIYQGDYLVNWDTATETALADDEVEYEERQGKLWYFKYPINRSDKFITIATTRPETMLGDTAVAVNPDDERYQAFIGKEILLPIVNRTIPIIGDWHVDPTFGTGAVKVTPAHDPNDYQIGLDHNLPFVNIMTPDGKINEEGGSLKGLTMKEAREAVVKEITNLGLFEKAEDHTHRVGISYRSKAVIEPYLSKQWFINMESFKPQLKECVTEGKVRLIPKTWDNLYHHWIDNLRDWCISRQLWWGHRIPVWHHKTDENRKICVITDELPDEIKNNPDDWYQDEDVLDTWFSSALWPLTVLGWPDKTPDMKNFYPSSLLITGYDILFFWVARMIMMGTYAMGEAPFPEVFLHGLIFGKSYWRELENGAQYCPEDEREKFDDGEPLPKDVHSKWEKMSKSKGNVIDVLNVIETFGTDATRMALITCPVSSRQIDLDKRRFEEFKHFANKFWNGARFVLMSLTPEEGIPFSMESFAKGLNFEILDCEDHWILNSLNQTAECINYHLDEYQFDQAATVATEFFWDHFCAWYVEIVKPVLYGKMGDEAKRQEKLKILFIVLNSSIRLIHPFAPFITEELFQELKSRFPLPEKHDELDPFTKSVWESLKAKGCVVAPYPLKVLEPRLNSQIQSTFGDIQEIVYLIRNLRGEMKINPTLATDLFIETTKGKELLDLINKNQHILKSLIRIDNLQLSTKESDHPLASFAIYKELKVIIPLPAELQEREKLRLQKELDRVQKEVQSLKAKLSNDSFTQRAPPQIVEKVRINLNEAIENEKAISSKLNSRA